MYDYLIVGAGLFGATCAYELNKKGYKVLVIDKRDHVAGNTYTSNEDGINVHKFGAHIFHTSNEKVWSFINQFAKFNNFINQPIANYKNEFYPLPFNMNTFCALWDDVKTPEDAKRKIEEEVKESNIQTPSNLEEQAILLVGKTIYEKLIKGYTAKQWGRDCKELPSFIIQRIPVRFTFDNNYFNDIYQGIPVGGYTRMVVNMLKGSDVRLNTDYKKHLELETIAKKVIYTGQIDEFFDYVYGPLEYRSLHFKEVTLPVDDYQHNAVINYTEQDVPYTRIIEHKHFEEITNHKKTIITKEYPATWNVGDEPYYPINNDKNNNLYLKYKELANQKENFIFGGRLGLYKYYDMDDVILSALELVETL